MTANKFVVWKEEYDVESDTLDRHHRAMIDIINGLYETASAGLSEEQVGEAMRKMDTYARMHFRAEEDILQEAGYPRLHDQRVAHEAYVHMLEELRTSSFVSPRGLSQDVLQFLKEWWLNHILKMDKEYAPYLKTG